MRYVKNEMKRTLKMKKWDIMYSLESVKIVILINLKKELICNKSEFISISIAILKSK